MNQETEVQYICPFCNGSFNTVQSRNSHKGKCSANPRKKYPHSSGIFGEYQSINEQIADKQEELKELYRMKDEIWQRIVKKFNELKEQRSVEE